MAHDWFSHLGNPCFLKVRKVEKQAFIALCSMEKENIKVTVALYSLLPLIKTKF